MAEIEKGILGGVRGKVGTVVGAIWRGKNIIRSVPKKSSKPASEAQQLQRTKFKLIANFLGPLNQLTGRYFGEYQGVKSRSNLAMSYQLLETVVEQDGNLEIDFSKVIIAKGVLPTPIISAVTIENSRLNLSWNSDAGIGLSKPEDQLIAIVYSSTHKMFYVIENQATRADETLSANIPATWTGTDNSVWIVWTNATKKMCSTSAYLGTM